MIYSNMFSLISMQVYDGKVSGAQLGSKFAGDEARLDTSATRRNRHSSFMYRETLCDISVS